MKKILLLSAVLATLVAQPAFAACDVQQATLEFSQFMQDLAAKNPQKMVEIQPQIIALNNDIPALVQAGNVDEICKRYDNIKASAQ